MGKNNFNNVKEYKRRTIVTRDQLFLLIESYLVNSYLDHATMHTSSEVYVAAIPNQTKKKKNVATSITTVQHYSREY